MLGSLTSVNTLITPNNSEDDSCEYWVYLTAFSVTTDYYIKKMIRWLMGVKKGGKYPWQQLWEKESLRKASH